MAITMVKRMKSIAVVMIKRVHAKPSDSSVITTVSSSAVTVIACVSIKFSLTMS